MQKYVFHISPGVKLAALGENHSFALSLSVKGKKRILAVSEGMTNWGREVVENTWSRVKKITKLTNFIK